LKLKTQLDVVNYSPRYKNFSVRRRTGGTGPHNVNLGPAKISETTGARMLKLKTQLDILNYPLQIQKFSARGVQGA